MFEDRKKKDPALTPLSDLGEFGLIDRLTKNVKIFHPGTLRGIGDDAAVIDPAGKLVLLSTDMLVEGIHFDLTYMPFRHLGYKAAVVNISDIAAMNGVPKQMTVSLAVSSKFSAEALDELYAGILAACDKYRVDLVGGDTCSNVKGLTISIAITGEAERDEVVYRSGARPGDLICVTGDLGSAYIGLLLLEREKSVFSADPNMQPELTGYEYQIGRQLKPEARTDIRNLLAGTGVKPTSMIDISDGLASETLHLCRQSGTGCRLHENRIPIESQTIELSKEFRIIPSVAALSGGEDYELLFTIRQEDYEKLKDVAGISVIGHMSEATEGRILVTPDGKHIPLTAQGWDGMKSRSAT